MDFEFTAEQDQLRESVRGFLSRRTPLEWVRAHVDDAAIDPPDDEVWRELAGFGVLGLLVGEEHGGQSGTMTDAGVVLEELGRALYPGPYASVLGAAALVRAVGGPSDHDRLLPGLASGETTATVALFEPSYRFEWRSSSTVAHRATATRSDSGSNRSATLTGAKEWVPDAGDASVLLVIARDEQQRLGVFEVDPDLATITATPTVDGTRSFSTIELDGVPATRLGDDIDPSSLIASTVDLMVVAAVLDGVGAASRALELAVDYAKERRQFGVPIGSFQAVQHLAADMLRDLELGRVSSYYALWAADEWLDGRDPEGTELHRAATMTKAWASDAFYRVGASAIQIFGGIGFTWEHDIHLFYKRLLTLQHELGGSSDHLDELAALILD